MLNIENLQASVGDTQILRGINLQVNAGEIHAIMGPNGSGKSTMAQVLAGREGYDVTGGSASFLGRDLLDMDPEERAREGLFLAFQYPVEIPGVNSTYFLRTGYNEMCKHRGQEVGNAHKEKGFVTPVDRVQHGHLALVEQNAINPPTADGHQRKVQPGHAWSRCSFTSHDRWF